MIACRTGAHRLLALIADKADWLLDQPNYLGYTPAMEAATHGHVKCLEILHQKNAPPSVAREVEIVLPSAILFSFSA